MKAATLAFLWALSLPVLARAQAPDSVFLEDFTWTELQGQIRAGRTTIIIPVGGTEQSGPDIALGKHNMRARALSEMIARDLKDALVAPVVAYVPEGEISPPTGHMRFPGTITVPPEAFRAMLASAALGFAGNGFRDIVLIGDHGGYQGDLKAVADALNRRWAAGPARAHYVAAYYRAAQDGFSRILAARHFTPAQIGTHAGLNDTSLTLALDPAFVRADALRSGADLDLAHGVHGDPREASASLGRLGVAAIVEATANAIRAETAARSPSKP